MSGSKMATVLRLVGIGWYVAICIGGGAAAGLWLDQKVELAPLLTLLGLGIGIALAMIGMFRMLSAVLSDSAESKDKGKG